MHDKQCEHKFVLRPRHTGVVSMTPITDEQADTLRRLRRRVYAASRVVNDLVAEYRSIFQKVVRVGIRCAWE